MGVTPAPRMLLAAVALTLAGCSLVREVEPDPAAIPAASLEALGGEPTGPVVELGRGRTFGIGWRYSIYESDEGWCTQLETSNVSTAGCGQLTAEGGTFGSVGFSGASDGPAPVEGIVSAEVAEVWIETSTGERFETTLMSLAVAGLDDKAFVGFGPENVPITRVVAVDAAGEVIEVRDAPTTGQ